MEEFLHGAAESLRQFDSEVDVEISFFEQVAGPVGLKMLRDGSEAAFPVAGGACGHCRV